MSKKTTKKMKNALALAVVFVVAALLLFSIIALRQLNQQSLDVRSDASEGEALVANVTQFDVLNGPFDSGNQYRVVLGFPVGTANYFSNAGTFKFRAAFTPGWTPVLVYRVNDIEKFRYVGTDIAGRLADYGDPMSTYFANQNAKVEFFMNLKKIVGNTVYICKYNSKMYQYTLGQPEGNQMIAPGATCVNKNIRTIQFFQ